jgi:signal transduction histidine kinase/ligand-binding sensor domain-containing protein
MLWLLVSLMVFVLSASGASPWFVRAWQTDDGLPDNNITGVYQNQEGYLWVATQGGLARFDGVKFREADLSIPSQRTRPLIRLMLPASDGRLWLALEGGVVVAYSPTRTNVFSTANGLPNYRPTSLAQASDGAVWVGYVDGSACRIFSGKVTRYTARSGLTGGGPCVVVNDLGGEIWFAKAGALSVFRQDQIHYAADLPEGVVRLAAARSGGLWISTGGQLMRMEAGKPPAKIIEINYSPSGVDPSTLYEDHSGAVWVGMQAGGLFRVAGTNVVSVPTTDPEILAIGEDREGNIWVGTQGGGLNRLRPRVLELENVESGLTASSVRSVCEDTRGALWVAMQNGDLARRENGVWRVVSQAVESNLANGIRTTCVTSDGGGGVWIGTAHGGLRHWFNGQLTTLDRSDGLGGESIRALLNDRDGNLWIAHESPVGVQRYRDGNFINLPHMAGTRAVRVMVQDQGGTVWLGTLDGFLFRADGDKLVDASAETLSHRKPVRSLYATPDGDLWIGYAGAGLGRLHAGKFSSLSTDRGLHDAYICGMCPDEGGGFWFSSDHGIFQVRQRELEDALAGKIPAVRSIVYGREEAMPSLAGNYSFSPGVVRSQDGHIWFATHSGLVGVNPGQSSPNHLAPPVLIESVVADGVPVAFRAGLPVKLSPKNRKIEIEFTALSFVAPDNVAFRCKLEGWDDAWSSVPRQQRSMSYARLPAGSYRFRVIACNNAGMWNEVGATLLFEVEPFFWNTSWFQLGVSALMLAIVAVAVRYYSRRKYLARLQKLEQEAALQKERGRIARDIHDELGANLTQISLLGKFAKSDLAEPEKAGAHVEKIAAIARLGVKSVDEIVWAVNPRNDNLSQLLDYAGQYAVDFLSAANIRCRIDFPEKIPARGLAAAIRHGLFMVVKEALNNAAKYSGASEITLRAQFQADVLTLSVEDNGRGFASPKEDALADGLRNMRQRATDIGGRCEIESRPGTGTKVRVELRLPEGA